MSTSEQYSAPAVQIDPEVSLRVDRFLATADKPALREWMERRIVVRELAGRAFRMLVDVPPETDGSAIVVFGEAGNGLDSTGAIVRARVIRMMVNPNAALVLQPNSTLSEANMNFSPEENRELKAGSSAPVVDRVLSTLESIGNPTDIVTYGPSQGGPMSLAYATSQYAPPSIAATVVEAPNVVRRSRSALRLDFARSGGRLEKEIAGNFDPLAPLRQELLAELGVVGLTKFGLGLLLKRDNLALNGPMQRATAGDSMERVLQGGGSVVHAWATGGTVSPAEANRQIADGLDGRHPRYKGVEVPDADHSVTNRYRLNGALVHYAAGLRDK